VVIDSPNFWSSVPVVSPAWVPASTPGTTRNSTCWRVGTTAARVGISSRESITIRPTPTARAVFRSSSVFTLPCSTIRSPGKPAAAATATSPPEHTSMARPSWSTSRAMARHRKALAA
jgi:hypothetical protein